MILRMAFASAWRTGMVASRPGTPSRGRAHRLQVNGVYRQWLAADLYVDLKAIAPEDAFVGLDAERLELRRMQPEFAEGQRSMAGHAHEFDRLAVAGLLAHHHGDVDAARIVAGCGEFLSIALPDHLEQIVVLEGFQRFDIVDFLQAQDVGARRGDGQSAVS